MGVCIWFGAPMTHRISGLSLAWHWQGHCGHIHLRSLFGTVGYGGWLFELHALVKVQNLVFFWLCYVL